MFAKVLSAANQNPHYPNTLEIWTCFLMFSLSISEIPTTGDPTTGHRGSASANEFQDLVDQDNGERESQHQDPVVEC